MCWSSRRWFCSLTAQDDPFSRSERRLADGPRPEQPRKDDVGLGSVHGNLGA